MNWDERFELAKAYYEHHGNLRIVISFKTKNGYTYDEDGFELGKWIQAQRHQYKIKELTEEHYEKLKSIEMVFEDLAMVDWNNFYNLACIYLEHYGNLSIPGDFRTINGYDKDEKGKNLGAWFKAQKYYYSRKKLSESRMERLQKLLEKSDAYKNAEAKNQELKWNKMYSLATTYYKHYKNLSVPKDFKTKDGYTKDENGENLGFWIREQRRIYRSGRLSNDKIKLLEKISLVFTDVLNSEWERMYALATAYYNYYGHLKVPREFTTKNGYEKDEEGSRLGKWLNSQYCRNVSGKISEEEVNRLKAIGMIFENQKDKQWEDMYALAKIYYEHYGNLEVPCNFKTKDGYTEDKKGKNLGSWVNNQRSLNASNHLSKKHIEKLKQIGMVFGNLHELKWERMYTLATAYYKEYHNLNVSKDFMTENGVDYDEDGKALGNWILNQRARYKEGYLSQEQMVKLEAIGMVFELRKNKCQNAYACYINSINYVKHKEQIDSIPNREFIAKINYLISQGIPVEFNSQLHPIFFMSSINMETQYGISLEQLIKTYQKRVGKVKVL